MNGSGRTLSAQEVRELLREVGALLRSKDLEAHIHVVGGAAMALVFDSRRITRDVGAAIRSHHDEFGEAAGLVAERHGLSPDWVNESAVAFMPNEPDSEASELNLPGLRVTVASPEHLIAMKLRACAAGTWMIWMSRTVIPPA